MKQKISMLLIVAMFVISMLGCSTKSEANYQITTTSEDYIPSETSYIQEEVSDIELPLVEFEDIQPTTSEEALVFIQERIDYIDSLTAFLTDEEFLESNFESEVVKTVLYEIKSSKEKILEYQNLYDVLYAQEQEELKWAEKSAEYESATFIWRYFKDKGYSDYATAGILGNIMAEVGGQTLYIQYWLSNSSYYGMCQWSRQYYPEAIGLSLEEQCDFLFNTIENEFDVFGYIVGLSYEDFIQIENEQTAALAFAKVYERCGSGSYSVRQSNATEAYNYFVD